MTIGKINRLRSEDINNSFNNYFNILNNIIQAGDNISTNILSSQTKLDSSINTAERSIRQLNDRMNVLESNNYSGLQSCILNSVNPSIMLDTNNKYYEDNNIVDITDPVINGIYLPNTFKTSRIKGPFGNIMASVEIKRSSGYHPHLGYNLNNCIDLDVDSYWHETAIGINPITIIPSWAYHEDRVIPSIMNPDGTYTPQYSTGPCIQLDIPFDIEVPFNQIVLKPFSIYPMRILDIRIVDKHLNVNTLFTNELNWIEISEPTVIPIGNYYTSSEVYAKRIEIVLNQPTYTAMLLESTYMQSNMLHIRDLLTRVNELDRFLAPMHYKDIRLDEDKMSVMESIINRAIEISINNGQTEVEDISGNLQQAIDEYITNTTIDSTYQYEYVYGLYDIDVRYVEYEESARYVSKPIPVKHSPVSITVTADTDIQDTHTITPYLLIGDRMKQIEFDIPIHIFKSRPHLLPEESDYWKEDSNRVSIVDPNILLGDGLRYVFGVDPTNVRDVSGSNVIKLSKPVLIDWWRLNIRYRSSLYLQYSSDDPNYYLLKNIFNPNSGIDLDTDTMIGTTSHPLKVTVKLNDGTIASQDLHRDPLRRINEIILRGAAKKIVNGQVFDEADTPSVTAKYLRILPDRFVAENYIYKAVQLMPESSGSNVPSRYLSGSKNWDTRYPVGIFCDIDETTDGIVSEGNSVYFTPVNNNEDENANPSGDEYGSRRYRIDYAEGGIVLEPSFVNCYNIGSPLNKIYAIFWYINDEVNYDIGDRRIPYCRNITNYTSIEQPVPRHFDPNPESDNYYPVIEYLHLGNEVILAQGVEGISTIEYTTLLPDFRVIMDLSTTNTSGSTPIVNSVAVNVKTGEIL